MRVEIPLKPQSASRPNWSSATGRATRAFMPKAYRAWRKEFAAWLDGWLAETDGAILRELLYLPDGRPIVGQGQGGRRTFEPDFNGYKVSLTFVLPRPGHTKRIFPFSSSTGDLDNLYKAVIDGFFESNYFKEMGLNDRWIQAVSMIKRLTALGTDEKPHIIFEIEQIR